MLVHPTPPPNLLVRHQRVWSRSALIFMLNLTQPRSRRGGVSTCLVVDPPLMQHALIGAGDARHGSKCLNSINTSL
jgi:hypothetical protein